MMRDDRWEQWEPLISDATDGSCKIISSQRLSGGCIAEAFRLELEDGRSLFLKTVDGASDCFEIEGAGLDLMRSTGALRIPQIIAVSREPNALLVLEWIEAGPTTDDFWSDFGNALATMHWANTVEHRFGAQRDNLIGATAQSNAWADRWPEFYRDQRLTIQVEMAFANHLIDVAERRFVERLYGRLEGLLACDLAFPSVLHGDLWNGNFLCSTSCEPVLIDPAAFYGHCEYELAMTKLFGGFDARFYDAYHDRIPQDDATPMRIEIYQIYHLLNHVNLFGRSYWAGGERDCRKIFLKRRGRMFQTKRFIERWLTAIACTVVLSP